ncbi:MAG: rlmL-A [Chlamydiales bacterium]|jgi:putative N6-adenine-specific DNA methylase|nr:rlmL-A [Chlamydiales bacterium]
MNAMKKSLYVTCQPLLADLLSLELRELGFSIETERQGVRVSIAHEADLFPAIYRINYLSRIASRVLVPLTTFSLSNREDLYQAVKKFSWLNYLNPLLTFAVDVTGKHPAFSNTLFAAQVVKDGVCDHIRAKKGERPSIDLNNPDVRLSLHLQEETALLSLDTSGQPLYRRGYRQGLGKAPLNEALAAALLRQGDYQGEPLIDPLAGSGTFLIEAALMATNTPPQWLRSRFAFQNMPGFSESAWKEVKEEALSHRKPLEKGLIQGVDCDREQIFLAEDNLSRAGLLDKIPLIKAPFQSVVASNATFAICNPPYGKRISAGDLEGKQLQELYSDLGDFFKQKLTKPAKAFVFTGNIPLGKSVGLKPSRRIPFFNGGLDSRLLTYEIY